MIKKKLFLVSREVWAETLEKALHAKGRVYDVREYKTEENPDKPRPVGFKRKK